MGESHKIPGYSIEHKYILIQIWSLILNFIAICIPFLDYLHLKYIKLPNFGFLGTILSLLLKVLEFFMLIFRTHDF